MYTKRISLHLVAAIATLLAQKLGVEVVYEDLLYPRFGKAVLSIQRDELTTYTLELRERHGCCWQLNGLFNALHFDLTSTLSRVVLLICHDLRKDVGRRLVKLVKIVLLGCWFLWRLSQEQYVYPRYVPAPWPC